MTVNTIQYVHTRSKVRKGLPRGFSLGFSPGNSPENSSLYGGGLVHKITKFSLPLTNYTVKMSKSNSGCEFGDTGFKAGGEEAQDGDKSRAVEQNAVVKTMINSIRTKIKSFGIKRIIVVSIALAFVVVVVICIAELFAKIDVLEAKYQAALEKQQPEIKVPSGDNISESELRQLLKFFNSSHANYSQILERQNIFNTKLDEVLNSAILINSSLFMIQKESKIINSSLGGIQNYLLQVDSMLETLNYSHFYQSKEILFLREDLLSQELAQNSSFEMLGNFSKRLAILEQDTDEALSSLKNDMSGIRVTLGNAFVQIGILSQSHDDQRLQLQVMEHNVSKLIDSVDREVEILRSSWDIHNQRIGSLQTDLANLKAQINDLNEKISNHNQEVTDLKGEVDDTQLSLSLAKSDINLVDGRVDKLEGYHSGTATAHLVYSILFVCVCSYFTLT